MAFQKGHKKKGGRQPGTKNKSSAITRESISRLLSENEESFEEMLGELANKNPIEFCRMYIKLLEFVVPKQREHTLDGGINVTWHEEKTYLNSEAKP